MYVNIISKQSYVKRNNPKNQPIYSHKKSRPIRSLAYRPKALELQLPYIARHTLLSTSPTPNVRVTMPAAIPPITGMLRRGLVLDLSVAFGFGTTFGYLWWYGFHLPRVRERDTYYARLEADRAAGRV
ncbi:hypothetical protein N7520_004071 [Penicillium odoratum]|uniref:uncharacterized protein n=1 Tax=Penicillium odoratum TaxID=1167516 RepID=UPI0025468A1D|nr:uncharacterized protein N7520_004071 [Penicillium odoratum]KAJ5769512.1 hypothetical protein N7520_004071 [Penicillium odoratum]